MRRKQCILNAFYVFTCTYVLVGLYLVRKGSVLHVNSAGRISLPKYLQTNESEYVWNNLILKDWEGRVVVNMNIQPMWEEPLRIWKYKQEVLAFIHIVKSGGTSFDVSLLKSTHQDGCSLKCQNYITELGDRSCPTVLSTLCKRHFDWTAIEELENHKIQVAPIVILRDPIERVVSHFHFDQKMPETADHKMRRQNFSEFLQDTESLMETRQVWYDGQSSMSWLAGTHTGSFVGLNFSDYDIFKNDQLGINWTYMLEKSINNLHKCLWFGILEELDKSIEMFRFQTGLNITIQHLNISNRKHLNLTSEEITRLQNLMPMDVFLFEYAKHLHNFRWQRFKGTQPTSSFQRDISAELPDIIHGCRSTRQFLDCPQLNNIHKQKKTKRRRETHVLGHGTGSSVNPLQWWSVRK